jgi:hypothetical protein
MSEVLKTVVTCAIMVAMIGGFYYVAVELTILFLHTYNAISHMSDPIRLLVV